MEKVNLPVCRLIRQIKILMRQSLRISEDLECAHKRITDLEVRHVAVSSSRKLLVYVAIQGYAPVVLSQDRLFFYAHILNLQIYAKTVA